MNALEHFVRYGAAEGRIAIEEFDESYYLGLYTDVAESGIPAYLHFILNGVTEGRNPSADFDASFYLALYPDVGASNITPFEHYYLYGQNEGRRTSSNITVASGTTGTTEGSALADTITGSTGDDTIDGKEGNDTINGGGGNDTISGSTGNDTINGEAGDDTIDGGTGDDVLSGGNGVDTITGGEGADALNGNLGDDILTGGAGNDIITGGGGTDTLTGGDGNDRFLFAALTDGSTTPAAGDVLTSADFISGQDTLEFYEAVFGDSGLTGTVALTSVAFNTDEATTLTDLTTAAGTDSEGYAVQLTGSTFGATLYDAVDTALAAGAAATGKGFVVISNGTDTAVLFDGDLGAASSGSLVEMVNITGLASASGLTSDQDLLIYS